MAWAWHGAQDGNNWVSSARFVGRPCGNTMCNKLAQHPLPEPWPRVLSDCPSVKHCMQQSGPRPFPRTCVTQAWSKTSGEMRAHVRAEGARVAGYTSFGQAGHWLPLHAGATDMPTHSSCRPVYEQDVMHGTAGHTSLFGAAHTEDGERS